MLEPKQLIKGRLYKVDARNFDIGVYDGKGGFIGIRYDFGDKYLFTEDDYNMGPPHGTAKCLEDLGINAPNYAEINEYSRELYKFLNRIEQNIRDEEAK